MPTRGRTTSCSHCSSGGELDLTFTVLPLPEGPFDGIELVRDPFVLLVRAEHPLARRVEPPTLAEVGELPLIGFKLCRGAAHAEEQLRTNGIEPNVVFRSDDNGTVSGLVAAGMGAALVPRLAVEPSPEGVAVRELGPLVPPRVLAIAWHRDRYRPPASTAFVATALEVCAELDRPAREALAAAG